jgi:hypothetical protein
MTAQELAEHYARCAAYDAQNSAEYAVIPLVLTATLMAASAACKAADAVTIAESTE